MFNRLKTKAALLPGVATLAVLAGNASAVIDTAGITASITEGQTAAVLVAVAFGVAVWAIRGVKMIRRA